MKDYFFDLIAALIIVAVIAAAALGIVAVAAVAWPANPYDVNRDGEVTLTDLVVLKDKLLEDAR